MQEYAFSNQNIERFVVKLLNEEKSVADVAKGVIFSKEYTALNKSYEEFLTDMYRAMFDRKPDKIGNDYWLKKLSDGTSREKVLAGFTDSTEFAKLCTSYGISVK